MIYSIQFNISDKDTLFKLAESGVTDLLKYSELLDIRDKNNKCILHYFASGIRSVSKDSEDIIVNYILNLNRLDDYIDSHGNTPLHYLAKNSVTKIMEHPLFNSIKNKYNATPYCYLLANIPSKFIKDFIITNEILKDLGGMKMPVDYLEKRLVKPTIKEVQSWGIPIISNPRWKKIDSLDILSYKKNNSLRYILED